MIETNLQFLLAATTTDFFTPSGDIVTVPSDCYYIMCPGPTWGVPLAQLVWGLRLSWALFFTIHMSRFMYQIFGNINIFDNSFFYFLFLASRWSNQWFIGVLPCIYGMDMGAFLTYYIFEQVDQFLNHLLIIDQFGVAYN